MVDRIGGIMMAAWGWNMMGVVLHPHSGQVDGTEAGETYQATAVAQEKAKDLAMTMRWDVEDSLARR